jgi:hypothetical protein
MVCKSGHCSLETAAALGSPQCGEERLAKVANATEEAGLQDHEDAKKVLKVVGVGTQICTRATLCESDTKSRGLAL